MHALSFDETFEPSTKAYSLNATSFTARSLYRNKKTEDANSCWKYFF